MGPGTFVRVCILCTESRRATMLRLLTCVALLATVLAASEEGKFNGRDRTNTGEPGGVIVHLFDWTFDDIAKECEEFLGPNGYAGVQVSPVNEHLVVKNRPWYEEVLQQIPYVDTLANVVPWFFQALTHAPWYERYQPVSYKIASRSGDEKQFTDMVERCNKAGVKVYVDVILNHMTGVYTTEEVGSAGSPANTVTFSYPAVPYTKEDFNRPTCPIMDIEPKHVRECELNGLHDLNQTNPCVRVRLRNFLNKLISIGVAGFRVDSVKYMWPEDLKNIFRDVDYLNCDQGFACEHKPYVFQDFNNLDANSKIKPAEYLDIGRVTDYQYAIQLSQAFRMKSPLKDLQDIGKSDDFISSSKALVFLDNPDTQRSNDYRKSDTLSHKEPDLYKMATAFMLAWPHGQPRIMSSYIFKGPKDGPPTESGSNIIESVRISDNQCTNGWICEHRWKEIRQMVEFRNTVGDEPVANFWAGGDHQISFSRGAKGFIVFNIDRTKGLSRKFQTGLPEGVYCDVMTGHLHDNKCTKEKVAVDAQGFADINIPASVEDRVIAIHVGGKEPKEGKHYKEEKNDEKKEEKKEAKKETSKK